MAEPTVTPEPIRIPGRTSVQDHYFADLMCFGCGPKNRRGLRLASYADSDGTVRAGFRPWPEHDNGLGYLNGGIIATVLDCHSAAAVVVESERRGFVLDGTLQYVTAGLDVRYRRPTPLHQTLELRAHVAEADENQMTVDAELRWDDKTRASVTATWKRWRPRS